MNRAPAGTLYISWSWRNTLMITIFWVMQEEWSSYISSILSGIICVRRKLYYRTRTYKILRNHDMQWKIFFNILMKIYICIFKMLWIICWHFELLETVLICAQYVFGCNTVIYVGNFQNTDRINFWRYILQHVSQKYLQAIFIIGREFCFKHAVYYRNFPIHSSLNLRRILLS